MIRLNVSISAINDVSIFCCQNFEFEVHDEGVLAVVVHSEFIEQSIWDVVDPHQRFKLRLDTDVSELKL